ncbi:AraC family transcriptional regulator [Devosia sp. 1566]|uniref:AraC family transcriptional regulator n=1 Tax=Devosia sp. 1566 TaxID=2499144 RepID=UPI000FD87E1E|nr:AraC family transcriptional regulator [Devosia sp. 1566]
MSTTTDLKRLIRPYALQPKTVTSFTRLEIMRLDHPTALQPVIYEPAVCLVLQGAKRAVIGEKVLAYGEGDYFIAAAEVAALGRISAATKDEPYLALTLLLEPQVIAGVLLNLPKGIEPPVSSGFYTSTADSKLLDAWLRLVSVLERPDEAAVLAPMIEREILFRLLQGPSGVLLRQIAGSDNRLSSIRKAMAWLREHYAEPVRVERLAAIAGMSPSVFHKHFKDVTALSPIQYQKQIRLHEARRRLSQAPVDAAGVAFSIGYESASQFSREYKRLFGASPVQDAKQLQSLIG